MFHACEVKIDEDRGTLQPQHVVREHLDEKGQGDGQEHQYRDRLQDVEDRDEHLLGAAQAGRRRAVDQREDGREAQGDEHPQQRPRCVIRDVRDVGRDEDRRPAGGEVDGHRLTQPDDRIEDRDDPGPDDDVDPTDPTSTQHLADGEGLTHGHRIAFLGHRAAPGKFSDRPRGRTIRSAGARRGWFQSVAAAGQCTAAGVLMSCRSRRTPPRASSRRSLPLPGRGSRWPPRRACSRPLEFPLAGRTRSTNSRPGDRYRTPIRSPGVGHDAGAVVRDPYQGEVGVVLDVITVSGSLVQPGELLAGQAVRPAGASDRGTQRRDRRRPRRLREPPAV